MGVNCDELFSGEPRLYIISTERRHRHVRVNSVISKNAINLESYKIWERTVLGHGHSE